MSRGFVAVSAKPKRKKEQDCGTISSQRAAQHTLWAKAQKAALEEYICSQPVLAPCPSQHMSQT